MMAYRFILAITFLSLFLVTPQYTYANETNNNSSSATDEKKDGESEPVTDTIMEEVERIFLKTMKVIRESNKKKKKEPTKAEKKETAERSLKQSSLSSSTQKGDWLLVLYGGNGDVAAWWRLKNSMVIKQKNGALEFIDNSGKATVIHGTYTLVDVGSWDKTNINLKDYGIKNWDSRPVGEAQK